MDIINCTEEQINWVDVLQCSTCVRPSERRGALLMMFAAFVVSLLKLRRALRSAARSKLGGSGRVVLKWQVLKRRRKNRRVPARSSSGAAEATFACCTAAKEHRRQQQINQHISEAKAEEALPPKHRGRRRTATPALTSAIGTIA